jgi:hypothetical protein
MRRIREQRTRVVPRILRRNSGCNIVQRRVKRETTPETGDIITKQIRKASYPSSPSTLLPLIARSQHWYSFPLSQETRLTSSLAYQPLHIQRSSEGDDTRSSTLRQLFSHHGRSKKISTNKTTIRG